MGQFSWLDCITGEQILDGVKRDVYVLVPKEYGGGHIKEICYDGYGRFGGHDIYDLVVDWNMKYLEEYRNNHSFKCDWLQRKSSVEEALEVMDKRDVGISIACYDEDNERIMFPIKITYDPEAIYEDCQPSKSDPNQGWLVGDDDEDEDDHYYDEKDDDYDEEEY
ncbi:MAG TPA: hypothetical protein DHV37_05885 [Erysipelotrichaceae bacterium]|nr:hypothetical protein [Erysipelotrichaceae bacterium]